MRWIHPISITVPFLAFAAGFQQPMRKMTTSLSSSSSTSPIKNVRDIANTPSALYFWGNSNKKEEDAESTDGDQSSASSDNDENEGGASRRFGRWPFFANNKADEKETESAKDTDTVLPTTTMEPPKSPKRLGEELDPAKRAESLRAQAERARLEAERMDAELTLAKIDKLERDMVKAVAKDEADAIQQLQRQIDSLQAKMRGEAPKPVMATTPTPPKERPSSDFREGASGEDPMVTTTVNLGRTKDDVFKVNLQDFSEADFEGLVKTVENSPGFMKKLFAQMTEYDFTTVSDINATEVAGRLLKIQQMDFSYSKRPKPAFTQQDIDKAIADNLYQEGVINALDSTLKDSVKNNDTAKALLALEYNYYVDEIQEGKMEQLLDGEDWLKELVNAVNKTEVDTAVELLYPKCTRKEDAVLPTLPQLKMLMSDVLPKASFTPRGEPEQVAGGYLVRGSYQQKSGGELIEAIDKQLAKNGMLQDKMTVLLTKDFTLLANAQSRDSSDIPNPDDEPPILFVMGPDIMPERKRIPLSVTTAFGIATSWYLSVYPFLLNPEVLKRTEEQLELADSSMAYDLGWLTELSLPLFVTFIGIQLAHEAGHKLAAASSGTSITFPTFVPSIITGVTSVVTQFKEPPKNKEAMFDVSIAGPLAGAGASVVALVLGSQLTLVSDPSMLPALPLDILRQSTLGGGIIDAILGSGALSVPSGAEASQAVSGMTVSLHPVAVAGYIGLILNGLALLPVGTTDGGRIALTLFGRGAKSFIGNIFLSTIFLIGILGSDLFLFYFSFLIAFQTGNEIPARNEVDDISFSRVVVATAGAVLALLTLIPFQ